MLITRDDIQRIGDEGTLLHFLEEKLNLPIPDGLPLEEITTKYAKFALGLSGVVANQVADCQELSVSPGEPSGIILIRFNNESGYAEALRVVAAGLDKLGRNPTHLCFICMNEHFQPFALAYFNDPESKDWQTAVLNIRAWTQENTHIHTSSEHELPANFFQNDQDGRNRRPPRTISPDALLTKLKNTGTPLSQYGDIHSGILTGCNEAFVIDEFKCPQLISEDRRSSELIKPLLMPNQKWKMESTRKFLVWIPSSKDKCWPWSEARNEVEAKRIFENSYSAISAHLADYESKLKQRRHQGKFYWEFTPSKLYSMPKQSKIVYSDRGTSLQATYDTSEALPLFPKRFIPTEDLSLLAILNSSLFDWYVQMSKTSELNNNPNFNSKFMKDVPIAARAQVQKENLSKFVQQILNDPDSLEVPDIERKIDQLVYELYELTPAEIALIEEETSQ